MSYPEQIERNKALYSDYDSGKFTIVDLVSKYRISSAAIYKIINRYKKFYDAVPDMSREGAN